MLPNEVLQWSSDVISGFEKPRGIIIICNNISSQNIKWMIILAKLLENNWEPEYEPINYLDFIEQDILREADEQLAYDMEIDLEKGI